MKKKWIIASSIVLGVIGLCVIFAFTLFSLKKVSVDFRTSITNISATEDEIIESANFKYGSSVFFHGKNGYISNIEKSYPYIKVINIETVFPSKFIIHVAEREEIFAVKNGENYYITDDEFKILRIENDFIPSSSNAMLIEGVSINSNTYNIGDFLNITGYYEIYDALYENNLPNGECNNIIEKITFSTVYDAVLKKNINTVSLKLFNGMTFEILNCDYGLSAKIKMFKNVFSSFPEFIGKTIKVDSEEGEKYIILTEENLLKATFKINNYYDYSSHDENDCYFDIIPFENN